MIKFLSNGSPTFKVGRHIHRSKVGFNSMEDELAKDPYFDMCLKSGIIKVFESGDSESKIADELADNFTKSQEKAEARANKKR